jgi:hypothetical protein
MSSLSMKPHLWLQVVYFFMNLLKSELLSGIEIMREYAGI